MFNITYCQLHASNSGYKAQTDVIVTMDAKLFAKYKKAGFLGSLYGIDISNEVQALTDGATRAYCPSVDDSVRPSKGIKTINLTYYQDCVGKAAMMGLDVIKCADGLLPKYGARLDFLALKKTVLKLVSNA